MNQIQLHVVIARYNENIEWVYDALQGFDNVTYFVYNKGEDNVVIKDGINIELIKLENLGRESGTYLYHIVHHHKVYNSNPDIYVIFTQGDIKMHQTSPVHVQKYMETLVMDAVMHGTSKSNAKQYDFGPHSAIYTFQLKEYCNLPIQGYKDLYGKWFEDYVSPKFPTNAIWWHGAVFCVKSSLISQKSQRYWKALHSTVKDYHNPETGHFMERSWYYIMTCQEETNMYQCFKGKLL